MDILCNSEKSDAGSIEHILNDFINWTKKSPKRYISLSNLVKLTNINKSGKEELSEDRVFGLLSRYVEYGQINEFKTAGVNGENEELFYKIHPFKVNDLEKSLEAYRNK